ncbi:hypothetical protein DPEC_G00339730 [Dallia pectoralis]|uniref:Uncharacterized protein n=1 Tax=Dallia pectoralis TaxID=75939 RepID=A0ACC2F505_DALPE|nr:hypothetical protein DPEC_G00339730 [Dallia pectoralis]
MRNWAKRLLASRNDDVAGAWWIRLPRDGSPCVQIGGMIAVTGRFGRSTLLQRDASVCLGAFLRVCSLAAATEGGAFSCLHLLVSRTVRHSGRLSTVKPCHGC